MVTMRAAAPSLPPLGEERLVHLGEYLDQFRDVFSRADQARSFALYLRGLLHGSHRKNVESIAEYLREAESTATDLAQSLQHFVAQSPWDSGQLLARYRSLIRANLPADRGTLVVHDVVFPKTGRHSVGVQRQFARSLGRKVNCQLAVVVGHVGETGYFPLTARLYLPAYWLRENPDAVARTIPEAHRASLGKVEIALSLLDELLAEGWPRSRVAAEDGYGGADAFRDGIAARQFPEGMLLANGLAPRNPTVANPVGLGQLRFEWLKEHLGLNHFEGRTWVGWHHHLSLVFAAYGFLATERLGDHLPPFPPKPSEDWSI